MDNRIKLEAIDKTKEKELFSSGNPDLQQYLNQKSKENLDNQSKEKQSKVTMSNFYSDTFLAGLQKKVIRKVMRRITCQLMIKKQNKRK